MSAFTLSHANEEARDTVGWFCIDRMDWSGHHLMDKATFKIDCSSSLKPSACFWLNIVNKREVFYVTTKLEDRSKFFIRRYDEKHTTEEWTKDKLISELSRIFLSYLDVKILLENF